MKTIIAPIDFSESSLNALAFAAELGKRANARLIIVHVQQNHQGDNDAEKKMKSVEAGLKKTFGDNLNCEVYLVEGNLILALKNITAEQKPDLIVMGTKGATGLKRILIGSNTVNVISKTSLPVLVIPEEALFKNFIRKGKTKIVLATDLEEMSNESPLNILKEIALMLVKAKVSVLNVRPKNTVLNTIAKIERDMLLSFFNPEIESERITVFSDNVMSGINFYLGKKATDTGLVAMIARDSGAIIQKHYSRQMASHTHLPLLVLRDN